MISTKQRVILLVFAAILAGFFLSKTSSVKAAGEIHAQAATSAEQLATYMNPNTNPTGTFKWSYWWDYEVPANATYQEWFFNDIVPVDSTIHHIFWDKAVPNHWTGDRYSTGYYYAKLFDELIPDPEGAWIGGGLSNNSNYLYDFWYRAVPQGWDNGFYSWRLWAKALPENWGAGGSDPYRTIFWEHAVRYQWINGYYYTKLMDVSIPQYTNNGYYYKYFFDHAVPDKICSSFYFNIFWNKAVPELWLNSFYYKKLWNQAVPQDWVSNSLDSYKTIFWSDAVPSGWVNSFYENRFWNKAVPENWVNSYYSYVLNNDAIPLNWANGYYANH